MTTVLRGISSMATRQVLAELASAWQQRTAVALQTESVGGVDAAKRMAAGEAFDVVFLASDAIDKLVAAGKAVAGSKVDIVRSGVAVAVQAGTPLPQLDSEDAVRHAVLSASTIGYSTGPSGTAVLALFESWGIAEQIKGKLVQAPPGVPVASLVANGGVALGFQQRSELLDVPGVQIAGDLPEAIQIVTIFSGAVCAASPQPQAVRELLAFMASTETAATKQRQGMQPA